MVYNIFHVGSIDPMDQGCPYGDQECPNMQGSRVPSHSFPTFLHHTISNTNAMCFKIDSTSHQFNYLYECNTNVGSYFKILMCRVGCGIEVITFYLQILISIIKKLLFTQTMLKEREEGQVNKRKGLVNWFL